MKKILPFLFIVACLLASNILFGQLEQRVSLELKGSSLENALYSLVDKNNVRLSFSNDILPDKKVTIQASNVSLKEVLDILLEGTNIKYKEFDNSIILRRVAPPPPPQDFTISGYLEDAETGERLIAASIFDKRSKKGTTTNEYGFFSITLPAGKVELSISYLGYEPTVLGFVHETNRKFNLSLKTSLTLAEIEVVAEDDVEEVDRGNGSDIIQIEDINRMPKLGGEPDLIRLTHLLPGVQTGTDGVGGVFIRGGDPGQNLVLIDGVPVYNISHAAGIFSVFNTNAIKSAKLLKGAFPARYGGRLSSVLDVRMKDGNKKEFGAEVDLGLLTTRFSLEGPILKDKSSFFLSGRFSLLDWYMRPITQNFKEDNGEIGFTGYRFYDINAKVNHTFSDSDRVYFSFYNGSDRFVNRGERADTLAQELINGSYRYYRYFQEYRENLQWGNTISAFRWNHLFSDKLFANITATYSKLAVDIDYFKLDSLKNLETQQTIDGGKHFQLGKYQSGIEDVGIKIDFDLRPNTQHSIRFGLNVTGHSFNPGALLINETTGSVDVQEEFENEPTKTTEYYFYFEDEIVLSDNLFLNLGVHASGWSVDNKNYHSLQPRVAAYWKPTSKLGFHASFGTMTQYLHLLSNSTIGILPTDLWVPSTGKVSPQESVQIQTGMDYSLGKGYSFSVEGYYKKMNNLINFTEGAYFLNDWEDNITTGEGNTYGVEFFLRKNSTKTSGWISYALAYADREFDRINLGRKYPFKYDRRHDLKIAFSHRFNDWVEFSSSMVFSSGVAFSLALQQYVVEQPNGELYIVRVVEDKNSFRMPYYHRLDANLNFYFKTKEWKHTVSIGGYNIYDRRNPIYYDVRQSYVNRGNQLSLETDFVQVWLIPFLPSLNYSIKF